MGQCKIWVKKFGQGNNLSQSCWVIAKIWDSKQFWVKVFWSLHKFGSVKKLNQRNTLDHRKNLGQQKTRAKNIFSKYLGLYKNSVQQKI